MRVVLPKTAMVGTLHKVAAQMAEDWSCAKEGHEFLLSWWELPSDFLWEAKLPRRMFVEFIKDLLPGGYSPPPSKEEAALLSQVEDLEQTGAAIVTQNLSPNEMLVALQENARLATESRARLAELGDVEAEIWRQIEMEMGITRLEVGLDAIKIWQYKKNIKETYGVDFLVALPIDSATTRIAKQEGNTLVILHELATPSSLTLLCKEVAKRVGVNNPSDGIEKTALFEPEGMEVQEALL